MSLKRLLTQGAGIAALGASLIIAGCGSNSVAAAPTATATATSIPTATPIAVPSPQSGFTTYKSSDGSYGFNYPSSWQQSSQTASGITFADVSNGTDFAIVLPTPTTPTSSYATLLKDFCTGFGGTKVTTTGTTTASVPLGSNTWNELSGTMTYHNKSYDTAIFGVDHGANTYFFIALAPHTTSSADASAYFEPMLTSFTFLK